MKKNVVCVCMCVYLHNVWLQVKMSQIKNDDKEILPFLFYKRLADIRSCPLLLTPFGYISTSYSKWHLKLQQSGLQSSYEE